MFSRAGLMVLLTLVSRTITGPVFESNPFLQVPAIQQPTPGKTQSNLYVVPPSTGQQLQQTPQTGSPPVVASSSPVITNQIHSYDCSNRTSSLHVHSQKPVAAVHVEQSSVSSFNTASTSAQTLTVNTLELNRRCLKSTGLFLGSSCNKFVNCLNGTATELSCPEGLLFNAEGQYCDRPENVQCNGKMSSATTVVQHKEVHPLVVSPIHTNLVQFSVVPSQQAAIQTGQGSETLSIQQKEQLQQQQQLQQLQQQQEQLQQLVQQQQQLLQQQNSASGTAFVQSNQITAASPQISTVQETHKQDHQTQQQHQFQQHHHQQQQYQQQHNQQYQEQHHNQQHQQHLQQQHQYHQHQQQHNQQYQEQHKNQQQHQQHLQQQHNQQHYHQEQHNQKHEHQQQQQHHYQVQDTLNTNSLVEQQQQQQHQHQQQQYQHQQEQQQQISQSAANTNTIGEANKVTYVQQNLPTAAVNTDEFLQTNEIFPSGGATRCLALRGQFPSNACHTFLNCWGGMATEQACPDGLLFNTKGYCDYPENVNCAGRLLVARQPVVAAPIEIQEIKPPAPSATVPLPISAPTSIPTLAANPTTLSTPTVTALPTVVAPQLKSKCLSARGQFPSTSCNKFVNCWDSIILEQDCPEGFLFSTKGYCDFSHNVQCGDRPVESRGSDSNSKSECPLENGTFRDRNNCSSYFTCLANKVVARYGCPEGFSYSDYIGVCDFSYRVDCNKEPLLIPGRSSGNFVPQLRRGDQCPADFATYRDANNCAIYYTCVSKTIVATYECPAGFSFNDEIGICDYAERVDCTKAPKIFQVPRNVLPHVTNDIKQKLETCTPGTMFPLNPQCTSVCLCRNGMAEIVQCPAGLAYDTKTDKCILPHLAKC